MPREARDTSDRTDDTPDTPGTIEPDALQPQEQDQRETRELTATAEQYLAAHPPSADDRQTRENHLDHAEAALHTPADDRAPPPTDAQTPDDHPEVSESHGDYTMLTADAEYHLAYHPPTPEELDARDALLDRIATNLQHQIHDSAPTPDTADSHEPPTRPADAPHPEDAQRQPQEPANPIADVKLERDLSQPHDSQLLASTEPKDLSPHEPLEPARTPPDPIALITSFTESDATKEAERPHMSERIGALNQLLDQNPYLRDRPSFDEAYRQAQAYIVVKALQARDALPPYTQAETADRAGVATATLTNWLHDHTQPELIYKLTIHETARRRAEAQLPAEALDRHLDPTTTYNTFREFRDDPSKATPHELATSIAALYRTTDHPPAVLFADFKSYHESGPRWMRTLADTIHDNRPEIERLVNQQLGFNQDTDTKLRLGVVDHTLFLWQHNDQPDNWLNLYAREYFYFHDQTKHTLMDAACSHLNVCDSHLSKLAAQLTDQSHKDQPASKLSDLQRHKTYLTGETLKLLLDATGKRLADVEPKIARVGLDTQGDDRGGIQDPTFPTGEPLNEFRARAYAIVVSDGSIDCITHAPMYVQSDANRIQYVKDLFRAALGELHSNLEVRSDGRMRLTMTVPVGRLLEKWGMPAGDKAIQDREIPRTISDGSVTVKKAYMSELIPEEGGFYTNNTAGWFEWKRAVVIDAGPKAERYEFSSKLSAEHKSFLIEYGLKQDKSIRDEPSRTEVIVRYSQLSQLAEFATEPSVRKTASEITQIIQENPCRLLESEKLLCNSLGIKIHRAPREIHIQQTGRVSSVWVARTERQEDAVRWALLAPPSTAPKREAVRKWLNTRREAEPAAETLRREGLIE